MPQRFLRPGLTQSLRFNSLDLLAQSAFIRLITLVDDHGRFEAHPELLASRMFPVILRVTGEQVSDILGSLVEAGMIQVYSHTDESGFQSDYLAINKWSERVRQGYDSKCPAPPKDNHYVKVSERKSVVTAHQFAGKIRNSREVPATRGKNPPPKPLAISHSLKPEPTAYSQEPSAPPPVLTFGEAMKLCEQAIKAKTVDNDDYRELRTDDGRD